MPEKVAQFCKDMQAMNRDFEYLFLDNGFLNKHQRDPYVNHMVSRGEKMAFVMDRLRVLALKEHGGIWIDPDAQPLRPLKDLPIWDKDWDFMTSHRSPYRSEVQVKRGVAVCDNTVMGSAKNGRMVNRLVNLSDSRSPVRKGSSYGWEIMDASGPDTCWLSSKEFYSMEKNPHAFILHDAHNLASWCDARPMKFSNA
jgi:hypothetical protein